MNTRRQCRRLARALPPLVILLVLLQATNVRAAFENNFAAYPAGARDCLDAAANASGCDGDTVTAMNDCLCSNSGNFIIASAECIGKADYADLETVYTTMAAACSFSNTPMTVSQKDFMSAGNGTFTSSSSMPATTTTTTTSVTSKPSLTTITTTLDGHVETITSTVSALPTNTGTSDDSSSHDDNDGSGMSSTTKIGIISGASVAAVAIVAVLAFFLTRMLRKRQGGSEEDQPILYGDSGFGDAGGHGGGVGVGGGGGGGGGSVGSRLGSSGTQLSRLSGISQAGSGSTYHDWKAGGVVVPVQHVDAKWAAVTATQDPFLTSPSPVLQQQQQQPAAGGVYELPVLEGVQQPVEMPATPMAAGVMSAYDHPVGQPQYLHPTAYR
ncbi:MAG: hypothetical protein STHCBS139747_005977 [Sporothrix thermara]